MEVTLRPDERIDQLSSQGIQIIQSKNVFAFSLDAVLLAHFVRENKRHKLTTVDLCAGNGAIGLFLNRKLGGQIYEVEIQPRLADMAERSVKLNDLTDRYTVINDDLANVNQYVPKDAADIVTCNPPYFKVTPASQKNPNQHLAIARHELTTTLERVVEQMSGLLKTNGHGYLVHRPDRLSEIIMTLEQHRLVPKRIQFIVPKPGQEANMVLIDAIKDAKAGGTKVLPEFVVADNHGQYTKQMMEILNGPTR
ncbi:tRNA1(Val) (adenine(37)-N6)-methyltransferase [Limosilactobacillus equigenerosi]|uniref:Methyltransferase n=1 Tax=Limosilactobacillus equigenerosi DSM 18793 = JCM 14505 TaxID=1423742 RepID=A0A0R1URL0_9LACO|nr:tRNA1(Val) (adenine(37)-N6)-methyltransferase [Limosilactobacillus equigenerosi]KRL94040.1 Methyltransferase [Limosilactobacillus equigenerosi DSM 18793 = JCM 14505]